MPDWTYHPLRTIAASLGLRRSQRAALRGLATLTTLPGGAWLVARMVDRRPPPPDMAGRLGAVVPPEVARDALRALPVLGADVIEIGSVGPDDLPVVRRAVADATSPHRCRVFVRTSEAEVASALAPQVDRILTGDVCTGDVGIVDVGTVDVGIGDVGAVDVGTVDAGIGDVRTGDDPEVRHLADPSIPAAVEALADRTTTVLATPAVLLAAGPGWFQRVIEAATSTRPAPGLRDIPLDPRRWPAWWWGLLVGMGMIGAGLGAAAITLGPVLLWYDRDFLGADRTHLHAINHHLVSFLQHDRITMAGTMVAIGALYVGLAAGGIRKGWPWARNAYLASGLVGFPTLFYFLAFGFVEPLHTAVTVVLFPMFLLATWRRPPEPRWRLHPDGPERLRRRALVGQLLLIVTGFGLFVGGATVSVVGLTTVFVPTDLQFLLTDAHALHGENPRLMPFIAHDRAGFGGALMAAALAITALTLWGWRRGESWVWWSLACAGTAGFAPAVIVHWLIGYTDLWHLAPVYLGIGMTVGSLVLARPFLCARRNAVGGRACGPGSSSALPSVRTSSTSGPLP
ncbi:hypothetical protein [Actinopolymorpha sp. B9G3]|uniref:hypothetical protein n=1 Tax=Actinopolymorpha sp. B9G3 TaxID=3158970 RepID=UPI0032D9A6FC